MDCVTGKSFILYSEKERGGPSRNSAQLLQPCALAQQDGRGGEGACTTISLLFLQVEQTAVFVNKIDCRRVNYVLAKPVFLIVGSEGCQLPWNFQGVTRSRLRLLTTSHRLLISQPQSP